jgi:pimeloyl-ACP methyl ester carboxylesterase
MSLSAGRSIEVDLGSHRLRVEAAGAGSPAFVCLHGLADSASIWSKVAGPLSERGSVVLVDQRAHGASGAPPGPYERDDLARDVSGVLDHLGISRAVLVGHSMGGIVSMTAALNYPDRVAGLVLVGTASQCSEKIAAWYEKIACAAEKDGMGGLARAIYGSATARQLVGEPRGMAHVTRCLKSLHDDPLTPKLAAIRCPALLVVGENDPMGPRASEIIQRHLPDATLEVVAGCGHWVHVDAPQVLLQAIERFLSSRGYSGFEPP